MNDITKVNCDCPNCGCNRHEIHHVGQLQHNADEEAAERGEYFVLAYEDIFFTCIECGYVITDPQDLNLLTITVYIVGDSISKRRQGLNKIAIDIKYRAPLLISEPYSRAMYFLHEIGYFRIGIDDEISPWIFTKAAWKKAQHDLEFRLTDKQYTVNVKEMF